jgi:dsDNA-binding SOS-regulon protein
MPTVNFYGFRKIRNIGSGSSTHDDDDDDDDSEHGQQPQQPSSKKQPMVCRFYHEFFQANQPELLYRIQRATKSAEPPSPGQIENLRYQLEAMKERMDNMADEFDSKLHKMRTSMEHDYQRRFAILEASYKDLMTHVLRERMAGAPLGANPSALRNATLASMTSMPDVGYASLGSGMPSSLMLSSLNNRPGGGGLYSTTGGGMQNLLRNTNPSAGTSDMSAFGMLGKFR